MIVVNNLHKAFKNKKVLKGLSFSLSPGEITALLGNNGSGKTTTIKALLGLIKYDEGSVLFDDNILCNEDIGYLPEDKSLYQDCSVIQQLNLIGRMNNIEEAKLKKIVMRWLEKSGLANNINTKIGQLSKGNQKKVALMACLIKDPTLIVMDEPFSSLDKENTALFKKVIYELKERNKIVLITSHLYETINDLADRFLYITDGVIEKNILKKDLEKSNQRVVVSKYQADFLFNNTVEEKLEKDISTCIFASEKECVSYIKFLLSKDKDFTYRHIQFDDIKQL